MPKLPISSLNITYENSRINLKKFKTNNFYEKT